MRVVIVYESMFGNTRQVAEAIGAGVGSEHDVSVMPVALASEEVISSADLVFVGGPTHLHGMSRSKSRQAAGEMAGKPDSGLALEPGAEGDGLREWLGGTGAIVTSAAAFDTKMHGPAALTGRASTRIDRLLRRHGARIVAGPMSFLVRKDNRLDPGELDRARGWGGQVVAAASARPSAELVGSE